MITTPRIRQRAIGLAAAIGIAATAAAALAPNAEAASRVKCSASMSNAHPKRYSYVTVIVHTNAKAAVTTTAKYKSTQTKHTGKANSKGVADIRYYISGATAGRKVPVSVKVTVGRSSASCATAFVPR